MDLSDWETIDKIRQNHTPFRFILDMESSLLSCTCGWREDYLSENEDWWSHVIEKEFPE